MKTLTDNLLHPRPTLFSLPRLCAFVAMCLCAYKLNIPSEPNFQTPRLSVTVAMIRTYNENCPKKHKKSKPNPNPIQTQTKPNTNPNQTQFQNQQKAFG